MRDFLAVVGLLALVTWGLCYVGYLTPAEVRAGLAELLTVVSHALALLAVLVGE